MCVLFQCPIPCDLHDCIIITGSQALASANRQCILLLSMHSLLPTTQSTDMQWPKQSTMILCIQSFGSIDGLMVTLATMLAALTIG